MRSHPTLLYAVLFIAGNVFQACSSGESAFTKPSVANAEVAQTPADNNPVITNGQWQPAEACDFLANISGLQTRGYKDLSGEGQYTCSSDYKKLGTDPVLPNNIAYYAQGNSTAVKKLKIVLNVNSKEQSVSAHKELQDASSALTQKAVGIELPNSATTSISQGKPGQWMVAGHMVEVTREDWATGKGYGMHFTISSPRQ